MTKPLGLDPFKNAVAIRVSREMALDMGWAEPTDAEKAERDRRSAEFRAKCRDAWHVYANAVQALDNLTGPGVRAVLDLHSDDAEGYSVVCDHCYADTEMGDKVDWPCETVTAIADAYGIALPTTTLYRDYR